ncbi:hypothetical protein [Mesorhizobium sp.]|uniref:hypothetical protein n=1 Tax=Mesorhizobium sp. TaxID=1871066 RepID=UPI0025F05D61|nr:hypothetical protein [Mesorhizobium sp.]
MHSGIDISGMPVGDEVDSFIILPPLGRRSEPVLREVDAFLKRFFPEYDLFANGDTEPFQGDFQILPICGVGGDEPGTLRILNPPEQSVMMASPRR